MVTLTEASTAWFGLRENKWDNDGAAARLRIDRYFYEQAHLNIEIDNMRARLAYAESFVAQVKALASQQPDQINASKVAAMDAVGEITLTPKGEVVYHHPTPTPTPPLTLDEFRASAITANPMPWFPPVQHNRPVSGGYCQSCKSSIYHTVDCNHA